MFISTMILSLLMPFAAEGLDEQVKQAAAVGLLSGDKPHLFKRCAGSDFPTGSMVGQLGYFSR